MSLTVDMIAEEGLAGLSMRKIASKAGLRMSTLYHYFSNKDDLIYNTFRFVHESALEEVKDHPAHQIEGDEEKFKGYVRLIYDSLIAKPAQAAMLKQVFFAGPELVDEDLRRKILTEASSFELFPFILNLDLKAVKVLGEDVLTVCYDPIFAFVGPGDGVRRLNDDELDVLIDSLWKSIQD